jgi:hypothetical protein
MNPSGVWRPRHSISTVDRSQAKINIVEVDWERDIEAT